MDNVVDFGERHGKRQAELEAQWERLRHEVGLNQILADAITEMVRMGASFQEVAPILRKAADNIDTMLAE